MVMKNWRSRKIENASPKKVGTISGFSVPIHSIPVQPVYLAKMMYSDTDVTWLGNMSVASTPRKTMLRPRHLIRAKA